jgi:hypothetical protein
MGLALKRSNVWLDRIAPRYGRLRHEMKEAGIAACCIAGRRTEGGIAS